jgi:hypothetical protein
MTVGLLFTCVGVLGCSVAIAIVLRLLARFSKQAASAAADAARVRAQLTSLEDGIDTFNESAKRILHVFRGAAKGGG